LTPRTEQRAGQGGTKADTVPASAAGTPVKSCSVYAYFERFLIPHFSGGTGNNTLNRKKPGLEFEMGNTHESQQYPAVPGPDAPAPDHAGRHMALGRTDDAVWLHPLNVQAFISYLRDAYRAGQASSLRKEAGEYLAALA